MHTLIQQIMFVFAGQEKQQHVWTAVIKLHRCLCCSNANYPQFILFWLFNTWSL